MKKLILPIIAVMGLVSQAQAQNAGVGTSNPKGKLDIEATNDGFIIPRVALTARNSAGPLTAPGTSEMVYNTATTTDPQWVTPGYYYWNGNVWVRLQNGSANITAVNGLT